MAQTVPAKDEDDRAHHNRIYVVPERWGHGIGGSLLDRHETILSDRGFGPLQVSVMAKNVVGVNFYESKGFHRIATTYNDHLDIQEYEYREQLRDEHER